MSEADVKRYFFKRGKQRSLKEQEDEFTKNLAFMGLRLRNYREALEYTSYQLADMTGISPYQIVKYERGERFPDLYEIMCLSKHLKVSVDSILGLSDAVQRIHARQEWYERYEERNQNKESRKIVKKHYQELEENRASKDKYGNK